MKKQIYDWDKKALDITDKNGNRFKLELRGRITIITGESSTGKTYLFNLLKEAKQQGLTDNIEIITKDNVNLIKEMEHKLIVIDNAEKVLSDKDVKFINSIDGTLNRYLIMTRTSLGLDATPNHYAEFVTKGKETTTHYDFSIKGWN